MNVMGAQLRKISLKEGALAGVFSAAVTGGMAVALYGSGRDPRQALEGLVPLFLGSLVVLAGINPVRNPALTAVAATACIAMMTAVRTLLP